MHLTMALGVGLIFLVVQGACTYVYWRWLAAEEKRLDGSELSKSAGGDPPDWITWVCNHFPEGSRIHGNYARDDAFQELNWRLTTRPPLAWLHRMAVIAPLLGVLITAAGFWWLKFPSLETSSTDELVLAIRPVAVGILLGGGLSIVNQFLLQWAELRSDRFRERARRWFDDEVWPKVITREESTNRQAADALGRVAEEMRSFARKHALGAEAAAEAAGVIERASDAIKKAVAAVSTDWRSSVTSLTALGASLETATRQFQALIPDGERVTNLMVNSVDLFGRLVEGRFAAKLQLDEEASDRLSQAARTVADVIGGIKAGSEGLMQHCELQKEAAEGFLKTFNNAVVPSQKEMVQAAGALKATVQNLDGRLKTLDGAVQDATRRLTEATPDLRRVLDLVESSATEFGSVVKNELAPAAEQHRAAVRSWFETAETTEGLIRGLRASSESLASLAEGFRDAGISLHASIEGQVTPANAKLLAAATAVEGATDQLSVQLDGLGRSLGTTSQTLSALTDRAAEALDQLSPPIQQFHTLVLEQLKPAAEGQHAAAEAAAGSLGLFRESAEGIKGAAEELRDLLSREAEAAALARASSGSLLEATTGLSQAGVQFGRVLNDDLLPMGGAIRAAVDDLRASTAGLGGLIADGTAKVNQQFQGLEQGLGRLQSLVESLRPLASTGPDLSKLLDGTNHHFGRLSEEIATLSSRLDEAAQRAGRKGMFGWPRSGDNDRHRDVPTVNDPGVQK